MKKKSTPKAQPKRRQAHPVNLPVLTDPHLVALLSFLDGDTSGREESYARANQVAVSMLTSLPLSTAFYCELQRPEMYDLICRMMLAESAEWADPQDHGAIIRQASYDLDGGEFTDPVTAKRADLKFVTHMFTEHSVFVGACIMYHMLKGSLR
jgi:hypothetical protein